MLVPVSAPSNRRFVMLIDCGLVAYPTLVFKSDKAEEDGVLKNNRLIQELAVSTVLGPCDR